MPKIERVEKDNFSSIVATKNISQGELVRILVGKISPRRNKYSIQIGKKEHIMDEIGMYINHSFTPNTKIVYRSVIAIRDIKVGQEITFNYLENEASISFPFKCKHTGKWVKKDA